MKTKYCVNCGEENNTRSKMFCSQKCYNEYYYQKNQEDLLKKHKDWAKLNKESRKKRDHEYYLRKKARLEKEKNESGNEEGASNNEMQGL